MILPDPPILVITDRAQCPEPLEDRALALFRGGCRWLSLREKDVPSAERSELLERLIAIGAIFGATVGIHDDLTAAAAYRSALHLPAGADAAEARRALGKEIPIGQSCHDAREIAASTAAGVDYITLGPAFATRSKPGYGPSYGIGGFAALIAGARVPVISLGGISENTLLGLSGTGISGVAIMGGAMGAAKPTAWFERMALQWKSIESGHPTGKTRRR